MGGLGPLITLARVGTVYGGYEPRRAARTSGSRNGHIMINAQLPICPDKILIQYSTAVYINIWVDVQYYVVPRYCTVLYY